MATPSPANSIHSSDKHRLPPPPVTAQSTSLAAVAALPLKISRNRHHSLRRKRRKLPSSSTLLLNHHHNLLGYSAACILLLVLSSTHCIAAFKPSSTSLTMTVPPSPSSSSDSSEATKATHKRRLSWSGSRKINTYEQDQLDHEDHNTATASSSSSAASANNKESQSTRPITSSSSSSTATLPQNQLQKQHQTSFFSSLLAGVGSGSLASVVCAPLDLVRTRMQVIGGINNKQHPTITNPRIVQSLHQIYLSDGIRGCFRGLGVTLATVPAFWGLYFPLYEKLKLTLFEAASLYEHDHHEEERQLQSNERGSNNHNLNHALIHLTSAITAGAVADIICNPMFVIRTRMQTEALHYFQVPLQQRKPHTILQTATMLYKEGSIPIFWRGLSASLLGLGHVGIQFPLYERFKAEARKRSLDNTESPLDLLLASGLSKMMAALVTYPHEVVRSRMMDARGGQLTLGIWGTLRNIVKTEGYAGLYVGLRVSLVRVIPNCCVTFVSYELIARWVRGMMD